MNHRLWFVGALSVVVLSSPVSGQVRQSQVRDLHEWDVKADKMRLHLQPLMQQHGVDMWIIMSRENSQDPALELFGGYGISGWYGHRNAYIFFDPGEGRPLESVIFGTHQSGHMARFFGRIEGYGEEGLAPSLRAFVHERDPRTIAINQSRTISMADGLTVELKRYLEDAVGPEYVERFVSSEPLFIDYVSRRTPAELEIAQEASWRTFHILRRAFSNEVITPGQTTLMDLYWWIKDEWMAQDLEFNFPASFDIQRQGMEGSLNEVDNPIIMPGDVLHVDFGVRLMGIVTDQQKMAYVLRPGETAPPAGLQAAFAQSARQGEIIAAALEPGLLGRDVKAIAEERGRAEGIDNSTYSHVQGNWVHGAGAWAIFDWPERYGDHPRQPVRLSEFWSIEYSVTAAVAEWGGQRVRMAREEDAWVSEQGVRFMAGPQRELWVIGRPGSVF